MRKKRRKKRFYQVDHPTEEARRAIERVNRLGRVLGAHPRTDQVINPTFGTALYRCDSIENNNPRKPDFWDILFTPQIEVEIRQARAERLAEIENNHKVR
jgi:hypothetical protein